MSIIHAASTINAQAPPGGSDTVTLSGELINSFSFGSDATATLKVDNNGNVYKATGGGYTQIDSGTDWVRPTSSAPGLYEVRYTGRTGDDPVGAIEDTWYALTSDFILSVTDTSPTPGGKTSTFTIEIRYNGGAVLDSASYTLNADREDF